MRTLLTKAVIPAAGLGTRFLPATKAQPKEMLPVVDKPAIQYVVEEAITAGIQDVLIITGRGKRSLADHFDRSFELEYYLKRADKLDELNGIVEISESADFYFARQPEPLGLGHAILMSKAHVGNEPFAVLLADDLMAPNSTVLSEMMILNQNTNKIILALKEVKPEEISMYGCVSYKETENANVVKITEVVEKPEPEAAPSKLAIMGRYVFSSDIFDYISQIAPGKNGELQLTDAIQLYLQDHEVLGYVFTDGRYDIGNKLDYLKTNFEFALNRPDLKEGVIEILKDLSRRYL